MNAARLTSRTTIGFVVAAVAALLVGANAHLVYVAVTSQPDCVAHARQGDTGANGSFRAGKVRLFAGSQVMTKHDPAVMPPLPHDSGLNRRYPPAWRSAGSRRVGAT